MISISVFLKRYFVKNALTIEMPQSKYVFWCALGSATKYFLTDVDNFTNKMDTVTSLIG